MLLFEQTAPQLPQLFASPLSVLVSQPSLRRLPLQSPNPALQVPLQTPAPQVRVATPFDEQEVPHPPQLFGSAPTLISQPSVRLLPLQSAKFGEHVPLQTPAPHVRVAIPLGEHTTLHPPQLFGLVPISISQPLLGIESQLAKPVLQLAMPHVPAVQLAVPFGAAHTAPQAPQWPVFDRVSTSQPFAALPSQSAKPALQVNPHADEPHVVVALARAGHTTPQPPQCAMLVVVLVSQPFEALLSQLPKPALQVASVHDPEAQVAVPLLNEQALPHAPQCMRLVLVLVSQPLPGFESQSPAPAGHVPTAQLPATQIAPAPVHVRPQTPQLVTLVSRWTSQPLPGAMSQLPYPVAHVATVHAPAEQPAVAFASAQTLPHVPQLATFVETLVSQPSVRTLPLQSAKPGLQTPLQLLAEHVVLAMLLAEQTMPQPPQLPTLLVVSTSQPSLRKLPLQLAKPAVHTPLQLPPPHERAAMFAPEQAAPHAPQ